MLENLNPQQKLAVETTNGPLLVLSGAGTGKTRVLTTRIAYILNNRMAMPWQVLALTFTNKAANEMKQRLTAFAESDAGVAPLWYASDLWCGTFHSICLRILRSNADAMGLRRDFLIYGEDEQKKVIKKIFADLQLTDTKKYNPNVWLEKFSRIKDNGLHQTLNPDLEDTKIFHIYNQELAKSDAVDFGDIILKVLQLFESNADILARYQNQFKYILVDEFQDTNNAQMQFLQMLTRGVENPNICCVGDDDQSIYSWRGAEIKHILNFDKTYPGTQVIRLETNYRSTPNILGAANSLIRHNRDRLGKDLRSTDTAHTGEPVYVLTVPTDWDEARVIADAIKNKISKHKYSDFAILIRMGSLSRIIETAFVENDIPYKVIGAQKFYDRTEIKDVIAYIRLLVYPFDNLSFERAISSPRRGFGPAKIELLRSANISLMEALKIVPFKGKLSVTASEFVAAFDFDWTIVSPTEAVKRLLDSVGYIKMWETSTDENKDDRINNINTFISDTVSKYNSLPEFLEHVALMEANDNSEDLTNNDAVKIMTIHAAKGLEFNTVFLPAWEEGIFPGSGRDESTRYTLTQSDLEEERRLAYVAITRARKMAVISNAMQRMVFGERKFNSPSRFITEMDGQFLDFQGGAPRPSAQIPTSYTAHRPHPKPRRAPATQSVVGKLCEHSDMGRGVAIEENGEIVTVAFRTSGIKKVARQYLKIIG